MRIERTFCDSLLLATSVETWFGAQPQGSDEVPSSMPVIVVNRPETDWLATFGGTDVGLAVTVMQVDYYAETAEAARRLADIGRTTIAALEDSTGPLYGTLDQEISLYDSISRAWRVVQRWTVPDYIPALP